MFTYRKNLEVGRLSGEGDLEIDSDELGTEVWSLVGQMEEAQPERPDESLVRDDMRQVCGAMIAGQAIGENTWYSRAEYFVGSTLLSLLGEPLQPEYLSSLAIREECAEWLSWIYHNGTRIERAAAAGLMPVVATLLIQGEVSDRFSNTHAIAINALHQQVGRTKLVK